MTKNIIIFGILFTVLALQTGCSLGSHINAQIPCSDPLDYYNELSIKESNDQSTKEISTLSSRDETGTCYKLHEAIRLSMPGSKQQNDKKALVLLKELKLSNVLSDSDQQFNNMLLQHVSQRQELRNMIGNQDQRLKKTETQLDQLKDIEVEIDKKERSVTSPIGE